MSNYIVQKRTDDRKCSPGVACVLVAPSIGLPTDSLWPWLLCARTRWYIFRILLPRVCIFFMILPRSSYYIFYSRFYVNHTAKRRCNTRRFMFLTVRATIEWYKKCPNNIIRHKHDVYKTIIIRCTYTAHTFISDVIINRFDKFISIKYDKDFFSF